MKYIITESQLETFNNYLDTTFDTIFNIDNIMYSPSEEDEDEWDFYINRRGGISMVFTWFDNLERGPIVKIYGGLGRELDDEYGDTWKESFKSWFMSNFGKTVAHIKY